MKVKIASTYEICKIEDALRLKDKVQIFIFHELIYQLFAKKIMFNWNSKPAKEKLYCAVDT